MTSFIHKLKSEVNKSLTIPDILIVTEGIEAEKSKRIGYKIKG